MKAALKVDLDVGVLQASLLPYSLTDQASYCAEQNGLLETFRSNRRFTFNRLSRCFTIHFIHTF